MDADSKHHYGWRRLVARDALFLGILNSAGFVLVISGQLIIHGWPEDGTRRTISTFVFSNCILTLVGIVLLRLAPRFAGQRFYVRWPLLMIFLAGCAILGFCLGVIINSTLEIRPRDYRSWLDLPGDLYLALLLTSAFGISGYLYEVVRTRLDTTTLRLHTAELERERARKLAAEARLASLESRIHPHFLFNTLNSISGLIHEDAALAERMVERLAALLRFSLELGAHSVVSLEQELKIATDYLEIERVRFGDRLQYKVEVPPSLHTIEVPPLTLQTLLENSIKHVATHRPGGIEIQILARRMEDRVSIEVLDDGPGFTPAAMKPNHGLDNLRERLRNLFGDEATLDLTRTIDGMSCVRVSLPVTNLELPDDSPQNEKLIAHPMSTQS
jgi:signal transduction histidine kinase